MDVICSERTCSNKGMVKGGCVDALSDGLVVLWKAGHPLSVAALACLEVSGKVSLYTERGVYSTRMEWQPGGGSTTTTTTTERPREEGISRVFDLP